jgi:FtsP/CotA-like multicopper oxidase with cupredoxin domain
VEKPALMADREELMILGDGPLGFVINGKEFPMIEPIKMQKGERIRVRMGNLGGLYHPMHLHGGHFTVVAKDGFPVPAPQDMNTISIAPGETYDVILHAEEPGTWLWHCHVLSHVTGPKDENGVDTVSGMVGVVQVEDDAT